VIPRPGGTVTLDALLRVAEAAGVARQKYPERLVLVDQLPRTASGKIRKDLLREDIRQRLGVERDAAQNSAGRGSIRG
jgi:acyl-CoA synthetase (AMP-forming)/AMP-acid ligase II